MSFNCPSCDKIMYPSEDGSCPYCRFIIRREKKAGLETVLTLEKNPDEITVRHEQLMPGICCVCGQYTENFKKIKYTHSTSMETSTFGIIVSVLLLLFLPIRYWIKLGNDEGRYEKVEVRMPICRDCRKLNKIKPQKVSFDDNHMTFIVHQKLRDEFNKIKKYVNFRDIKSYDDLLGGWGG